MVRKSWSRHLEAVVDTSVDQSSESVGIHDEPAAVSSTCFGVRGNDPRLRSRLPLSCDVRSSPESLCLFQAVWDRLELGIVVVDTEMKSILARNQAAASLLKPLWPRLEYEALANLVIPPVRQVGENSPHSQRELDLPGGRIIGYTVHRTGGSQVAIFFDDITERLRLQSVAEAANLMDNIGYVFAGIRHELGNPVHSIKMTTSVLRRNLHRFDEKEVECYVQRIQNDVGRVEFLLKSLRTFSLYEELTLVPVDLNTLLAKLLDLSHHTLAQRGVKVVTTLANDVPLVTADARALQQAWLNLLTNALDALEESPIKQITLSTAFQGDHVTVKIDDTGCGMTPSQLEDLFRPFHTNKPDGTGLGMVIVKRTLTSMGAQLTVESELNKGTAITMSFPLPPVSSEHEPGFEANKRNVHERSC